MAWEADNKLHSGRRARCVELVLTDSLCNLQGAENRTERGFQHFTVAGGVVVVANALIHASGPLDQARYALSDLPPASNSGSLNGLLYVATVMLQSVLDSVASLAQRISDLPGQNKIYFHDYQFVHSSLVWMSKHQQKINAVEYDGKRFYDYANFIKHEQPWVGN
jgi:hypothetical protein